VDQVCLLSFFPQASIGFIDTWATYVE
jgi:hypothetical protein